MRFIFSPIAALLLTGIVGIICISLYFTSQKISSSSKSVTIIEKEVASMEAKVNRIEQQARIATSSTAKEKLFRGELLLQRPNEFVVQIPDLEVMQIEQTQEEKSATPWENWKTLLF